jgi:hypothetical protein
MSNPLRDAVLRARLPRDAERALLMFVAFVQPSGTGAGYCFATYEQIASAMGVPMVVFNEIKARFDSGALASPLLIEPASVSRYGGKPEACFAISVARTA